MSNNHKNNGKIPQEGKQKDERISHGVDKNHLDVVLQSRKTTYIHIITTYIAFHHKWIIGFPLLGEKNK